MEIEQFEELLLKAELTRKEFCEQANISYSGMAKWGQKYPGANAFPGWVESWLLNYIKAKHFESIVKKVDEIRDIERKA